MYTLESVDQSILIDRGEKSAIPGEKYFKLEENESAEEFVERLTWTIDQQLESLKQAPMSDRVKYGIEAAKDDVLRKIGELTVNTQHPAREDMKALYFADPEFEQASGEAKSTDDKYTGAFESPFISYIVLREMKDVPDYIIASNAQHEWSHKYIERLVNTFKIVHLPDGTRAIELDNGRQGMNVKMKKIKDGKVRWFMSGNFFNELGAICEQGKFIHELLTSGKHRDVFSEEIQQRNELLKKEFGIENTDGSANIQVGHLGMVKFDAKNIHFDKNGKSMHLNSVFLLMQLGDDLDRLTRGSQLNISLTSALWYTKADLGWQSKLRNAIDSRLGNGTYRELMELEKFGGLEILKLLQRVQHEIAKQQSWLNTKSGIKIQS